MFHILFNFSPVEGYWVVWGSNQKPRVILDTLFHVGVQGLLLRSLGAVKSKGGGSHRGRCSKEATLFCIKLYFLYCYSANSWLHSIKDTYACGLHGPYLAP